MPKTKKQMPAEIGAAVHLQRSSNRPSLFGNVNVVGLSDPAGKE